MGGFPSQKAGNAENAFIMIVAYWHYMESCTLVNIGLGNGSVPDGTELLPEPVLMYHQ